MGQDYESVENLKLQVSRIGERSRLCGQFRGHQIRRARFHQVHGWYSQSVEAGGQREEWGYETRAGEGSVVVGERDNDIGGFTRGRCRVLWT